MNERDEDFLRRWSRRKIKAKRESVPDGEQDRSGPSALSRPGDETPEPSKGQPAPTRHEARPLTEEDFADVDFDSLNAQSDYSRFLAPNVPESIKSKALRKLWASSEIFSQVEPFQDYAEDYTDAARCVPMGALKTAYRIGRGFLTDEEAAEWEKLGDPKQSRPEASLASATSEEMVTAEQAARTADKATDGKETNVASGGPVSADLRDGPEQRKAPPDEESEA
jgi:hypothetical protein